MRNSWSLVRSVLPAFVVLLCLLPSIVTLSEAKGLADAHHALYTQGTVTSSPTLGPVSAIIAMNGSGWQGVADGTSVTFGYGADANCASYTPVADSQPGTVNGGAFSGWFRWPTTAPGTYTVCAAIGSSPPAPANTYTVLSTSQPQISISASTLTVGQRATVTGSDYLPGGSIVQLALQSEGGGNSVSLGSVVSGANGSFSKTFTVPANPTGSDMILATVGGGWPPILISSVTFTVNKVRPTATATTGPTPPATPGTTPTRTTQTTPTAGSASSTATAAATPGAEQTAVPTSSSHNSQSNVDATATDGSTDLQIPLIVMGAIVLLSIGVLVVALIVRRRNGNALSPRRVRPGRNVPSMEEMMPVANAPSSWSGVPGSSGGWQPGWNTAVPAMNNEQMTPISVGATSMPVNPFGAGYPQAGNLELAAKTWGPARMSLDARDGMPASTLSRSIGQVPLQPSATPAIDPLIDPLLEAMMRQAQAGLFVIPKQRKEPIQRS